jgi:hypothetical protein
MKTCNIPTNTEVLQRFEILKKYYVDNYNKAQEKLSYLSSIEAIARNIESQGSAADMLESFTWNFDFLPGSGTVDIFRWPDHGAVRWMQIFAGEIAMGCVIDDDLQYFSKLIKYTTAPEHLKQSIVQRFEILTKRQELDDHVFIIRAIISQACLKLFKNLGDDFNPNRETPMNSTKIEMMEKGDDTKIPREKVMERARLYPTAEAAKKDREIRIIAQQNDKVSRNIDQWIRRAQK